MKASLLLLSTWAGLGAGAIEDSTLASLQREMKADPEAFAEKLRHSSLSSVLPDMAPPLSKKTSPRHNEQTLPLVFLHGMGDSCFNRGMESLTESSGEYMGVYSVCIPTGKGMLPQLK